MAHPPLLDLSPIPPVFTWVGIFLFSAETKKNVKGLSARKKKTLADIKVEKRSANQLTGAYNTLLLFRRNKLEHSSQ
jgi:hypothetical protein